MSREIEKAIVGAVTKVLFNYQGQLPRGGSSNLTSPAPDHEESNSDPDMRDFVTPPPKLPLNKKYLPH